MNKTMLNAVICAFLLTACGGGSGSSGNDTNAGNGGKDGDNGSNVDNGNGGNDGQEGSLITYVYGTDSIVAIDLKDNSSQQVASDVEELFLSLDVNADDSISLAPVVYLSEGRFHKVTGQETVVVSNATEITELCEDKTQYNGDNPRVFYQLPGEDQDCNLQDDNQNYYIEANMGADSAPVSVSNALIFDHNTREIQINAQEVGYLAKEGAQGSQKLNFYNETFSQKVVLNTDDAFGYFDR